MFTHGVHVERGCPFYILGATLLREKFRRLKRGWVPLFESLSVCVRGSVTNGASFKKSCFGAPRSRCHPSADSFLASNARLSQGVCLGYSLLDQGVILALATAGVHEAAHRGRQVSQLRMVSGEGET